MSNDISTQYTKEQKKKCGEHVWFNEKIRDISPADYGMFLASRRKRKKKR